MAETRDDCCDRIWSSPAWDFIDTYMLRCGFILGLVTVLVSVLGAMFPPCLNGFYYENGACNCNLEIWAPQCAYDLCKFGVPYDDKCQCFEKYSGVLCDECNAQFAHGKCTGPCNITDTVLYYGPRCENKCDRTMEHGTCTSDGPLCDENFSGPACDVTCDAPCGPNETCENGKCQCKKGYYGDDCSLTCGDPPCNNKGVCTHGVCSCRDMFKGVHCEVMCKGDVRPCNGHGTCLGDGSCECDAGWEARDDCSCNSLVTCNGKGNCTADGCECEPGYLADCDVCEDNYANIEGECVPCSGCVNGKCENVDGAAKCVCDENFTGDDCSNCDDDFYPHGTCDTFCDCGDHGTCTPDGKGCTCAPNFAEPDCRKCEPDYYPKFGESVISPNIGAAQPCSIQCNAATCNNRGTCDEAGNCVCIDGAKGVHCEHFCPEVGGKVCAGHGTCVHDPIANTIFQHDETGCMCEPGWFGQSCNYHSPQYNGHTCGNNGYAKLVSSDKNCSLDSECDGNSFCHAEAIPFNDIWETCGTEECTSYLESVNWHDACMRLAIHENSCKNCDVQCSEYPQTCAYDSQKDTTSCGLYAEEATCVRDDQCAFVNGTCRGRACTDVAALPPPAGCEDAVDDDTIYCSLRKRILDDDSALPVPPPVPVRDIALYKRAAERRGACTQWPLARQPLAPATSGLVLRCYGDDTIESLTSASIARPDGCFVERIAGTTPAPVTLNVDASIESDCLRAGTSYKDCNFSTGNPVLPHQPYMRAWASTSNSTLTAGNVSVRFSNGYAFVAFVGEDQVSDGIPRGDWELVEFHSGVLRIGGKIVGAVASGDLTLSGDVAHVVGASSKTCAERRDQVAGPFDAQLFAGVDADLATLCMEPVSNCRLKNENINPIDVDFDGAQCDANATYMSDAQWKSCRTALEPWLRCDVDCARDMVGRNISCLDECGVEAVIARCNGNDGYPQELTSKECEGCDYILRNEFTLERCEKYITGKGKCTSATCECDAGNSGEACEIMCPIGGSAETCGGNGRCTSSQSADEDTSHEGIGVSLVSDGIIVGECQCIIGSGSACLVPCEKCDNGRYALGSSQKGVCNDDTGGCVALPPGLAYDLELAKSELRANNSAAFTIDGYVLNMSHFKLASVVPMLQCDPVEQTSVPAANADTFALLAALNAGETMTGIPHDYLVSLDLALEPNVTIPSNWSDGMGIPFDKNTSVSVFTGAYVWKDDRCESDRSDLWRRIYQMMGVYTRSDELESLVCETQTVTNTLELGPTPVLEYSNSDDFKYAVTSDDVGYVIDFDYPLPPFASLKIKVGSSVLEILFQNSSYEIEGVATPVDATSRIFINGTTLHKCKTDMYEPYEHVLQMNTLYRGKSGVCGYHADKQCPGSMTALKVPCSGHGVCDQPTCKCTCDVTPEESARHGAQRLLEYGFDRSPYRGTDCGTTCPGYDGYSMSSVCSGNGHCNLHGECECSEGFTGEKCEFKCPVVDGKVCNNHGLCYLADVNPQEMSDTNKAALAAMEDGVVADISLKFDMPIVIDGELEGDHTPIDVLTQCRRIDANKYECATCSCDSETRGFGQWTGPVCNVCANNTWGVHCDQKCEPCDGGLCSFGKSGNGQCMCGSDDIYKNGEVYYHVFHREFTQKLVPAVAPSPPFNFGDTCGTCKEGFVGENCKHDAEVCLMGGRALYEPNDRKTPPFTICECVNIAFDPENNCCPVGFGVPIDGVDDLPDFAEKYKVEDLAPVCKPCPTADNIQLDMENPLVNAPKSCGGSVKCDRGTSNDTSAMHCNCAEWIEEHNGAAFQTENCVEGKGFHATTLCDGGYCLECESGKYSDTVDHGACKRCPPGRYQASTGKTACTQCPVGYIQPHESSISCVACTAGRYQDNEGATFCKRCEIGEFLGSSNACEACNNGQYQDQRGQTECKACTPGKYTPNDGGFYTFCDNCVPGRYSAAGASSCERCAKGHYTSQSGQTSCKACPRGYYQDTEGKSNCKYCPKGAIGETTARTSRRCNYWLRSNGQQSLNEPSDKCNCGTECQSGGCHNCHKWESNCVGCRSTAVTLDVFNNPVGGFCTDCLKCSP